MNKSKVAIVVSQIIEKIEMICGGLWAALFAVTLCVSLFDDVKDGAAFVITALLLVLLGVWVFLCGLKRRKMRLEFKKYVTHLSADPTGSLENIAAASGTSVDVVQKNLQFMVKKKFFADAYLDKTDNRLVLSSMEHKRNEEGTQDYSFAAQSQPQKEIVYKACKCPNCGGMNKIAQGIVAECDFCGSPLQG